MPNPSYLFSCGHRQEDVGALRFWEAILNTDILPQFDRGLARRLGLVRRGGPVTLPYLPCSRCRDENNFKSIDEHLQRICFPLQNLTPASLAETSQIFVELLPLRSQSDHLDQLEHLDRSKELSEFCKLMSLWTHTLSCILTPSQYEGPFLSVVKRLYGFDVMKDVTASGLISFSQLQLSYIMQCYHLDKIKALFPIAQVDPNEDVQGGVAAIEALMQENNNGVLTSAAALLIDRDGKSGGPLDLEKQRVDNSLKVELCNSLSNAYGLQNSIQETLREIPGFGTTITDAGEQERVLCRAREPLHPFWMACVKVRKGTLDLAQLRKD